MSYSNQAESELLTAGALDALDIQKQPFSTDAEHHTPYINDAFQDVLNQTQMLLQSSDQLPIIVGTSGAGKSSLLSLLISSATDSVQYFIVEGNQQFNAYNVFAGMLEAFQRTAPEDFQTCLDELSKELLTLEEQAFKAIILLDDAHEVPATELYKLISGMLYMRKGSELRSFRIALTAQPDFENYVEGAIPSDSGINFTTLKLPRLTAPDTSEFLKHHLQLAGFHETLPVNIKQLDTINKNSDGLPGSISKEAVTLFNELFKTNRKADGLIYSVRELMNQSLTKIKDFCFDFDINKNYVLAGVALLLIAISTFMFTSSDDQELTVASTDNAAEKSDTVIYSEPLDINAQDEDSSGPPKLILLSELNSHNTSNKLRESAPTPPPIPDTSAQAQSTIKPPVEVVNTVTPAPPPVKVTETVKKVEPKKAETTPVVPAVPEPKKVEKPAAATTESDTVASANTPELEKLLESANWVLLQPPTQFTVQLIASSKKSEVEAFIVRHHLEGPNSIFGFQRGDEAWFALIHGLYPEIEDAKEAVKLLPQSVRSQHPWIRQIKSIQDSLKN